MSAFKRLIDDYLKKLRHIASQPDASSELSFRPALSPWGEGVNMEFRVFRLVSSRN